MKIGEQDLSLPQQRVLGRQWFLYLHDQISLAKDFRMIVRESRSGFFVLFVRVSCSHARPSLDVDFMPQPLELVNNRWKNSNPAFLFFNLLRNTNFHRNRIQDSEVRSSGVSGVTEYLRNPVARKNFLRAEGLSQG